MWLKLAESIDFDPKTHLFLHLRSWIDPDRLPETVDMSYDVWGLNTGPLGRVRR